MASVSGSLAVVGSELVVVVNDSKVCFLFPPTVCCSSGVRGENAYSHFDFRLFLPDHCYRRPMRQDN